MFILENGSAVSFKDKHTLTTGVSNTLLSNYSREVKTSIYPKTCMWMFVAALFIITQKWKQSICPPTDEWINTLWYILTVECHSATNNELVIHVITWIAKASCWVRVANLKTPYTVWFYIYNILKNKTIVFSKIIKTEQISDYQALRVRRRETTNG